MKIQGIQLNEVRLPVLRKSGELEALPWGYDQETGVMTLPEGIAEEWSGAIERCRELEPDGVIPRDYLGKSGEELDGALPGLRTGKRGFHIILPLLRGGEVGFYLIGHGEEGLVEVLEHLSDFQRAGDESAVSGHPVS